MPDSSTDPDPFEIFVGELDTPMLIVTASHEGERAGCLVGFWSQASIMPRRLIVMLSKMNHTYRVAAATPFLAIHVLRPGDAPLAARFGETTGDETDKFEGLKVIEGPGLAPVIEGVDWVSARVLRTFDVGDHVAFLLAPNDGLMLRTGAGFYGFASTHDLNAGHPAQ